ncbi:MAG TPA: hypothetical protein VJ608_01650 [Albitalea sp.]|nr:hypothetical protein [Albitalea sp.]
MDKSPLVSNPFALMMDPAAVIQAMETSDRLGRLQRRICKPLDKPVAARASTEVDAFDHAVDEVDVDPEPEGEADTPD